ncbi:MAG: tetraacyldisaccharide 4'-kinase [Planctomycetes bacterium]|nr:tetraacyldisaccharide 4'-kinase [Planctomycetota bacterium]
MAARHGLHPLRQLLWPLGLAYGAIAALRNWTFARGLRHVHRLPVPVVAIGNLTVGGTGKTPTVLWLCQLAKAHGRNPGVLARGYGRAPGATLNDEGTMLAARLPWLPQEQDPDRVAGARRLVQRGVDLVVLDDGFQHRRLHRDRDVVCVDAQAPFGNGFCLPAGDLREFRSGLARADVVLVTRAAGLTSEDLAVRLAQLRELAPQARGVFACDHAPTTFVRSADGATLPLDAVRGQSCVLLSAIARPASFRATLERLGARVTAEFRHRDHHRFTAADVDAAAARARAEQAWLVVTEKDEAKLAAFGGERHVLRIDLRFFGPTPALGDVLP